MDNSTLSEANINFSYKDQMIQQIMFRHLNDTDFVGVTVSVKHVLVHSLSPCTEERRGTRLKYSTVLENSVYEIIYLNRDQ